MNQQQMQKSEDLAIEWYQQKQKKYIVKFNNIHIPIEMDKAFFSSVMKDLHN